MRVTMCSPSRFTAFDGARQLHRHGMLHHFITQYPKFKTRQWGIPDEIVSSFLITGIINRFIYKNLNRLRAGRSGIIEAMHRQFSREASRHIPHDTDILYGLSSFMPDAPEESTSKRPLSVVDHGSLHQRTEKTILQEECDTFGFLPFGNWQYDWLLEKEDAEFQRADFIITASSLARKTMIDFSVPSRKIFVNNFGTDLSMFYPMVKQDNVFRIIFCGGLNPLKGVHYLARAFSELKLPHSELWLIGPPPVDGRLRAVLLKYRDNNIMIKGAFPQQLLGKMFCQGSVFVHPSLSDGWGLVVLQAMACGLPVIVTDMTGAMDAVTDGINGFIAGARSVDTLKEKILYMYENPDARIEMGRNALETVREGYSWDAYGERLCGLLSRFYREAH